MATKGRYRSIHSVLLDDADYRQLSSDARLLFLSLKVSRLNNPAGIFLFGNGGMETLRDQTKLSRKRLRKALVELEIGKWLYYNDTLIWLRNSLQFEPTFTLSNQKHSECVLGILRALPANPLVAKFCSYYDIPYPFDTPAITPRSTETHTHIETESITENGRDDDADVPTSSFRGGEIIDLFNATVTKLPGVTEITPQRTKSLNALGAVHPERTWWTDLFNRVQASDFLTGVNDRNWRADLDWILKASNIVKIMEGNYDNRIRTNASGIQGNGRAVRADSSKYEG